MRKRFSLELGHANTRAYTTDCLIRQFGIQAGRGRARRIVIGPPPTMIYIYRERDLSTGQQHVLSSLSTSWPEIQTTNSTPPTSVPMTFDTSLDHVKTSTVDPNASVASEEASHVQPKPTSAIHHMTTQDAYDQWASVYDSDGNMLQAIDDLELATLLPEFLAHVTKDHEEVTAHNRKPLCILDVGCGTGRNTRKLLDYALSSKTGIHILGLDFSQPMLDIAHSKLSTVFPRQSNGQAASPGWSLHCCDVFAASSTRAPLPPAHAIVSTLVLEHVPLDVFFSTLASLLLPRGLALVTNMHHEMGRLGAQAGFVSADGVKVRGNSFVYTVEDMVQAAKRAGLEVLWVRERRVEENDVLGEGARVGRRGRKWVGIKVWAGIMARRVV